VRNSENKIMRYVLAAFTFAAAFHFGAPAQAESRVFIIAANADGYGIDRCLATGAACGAAAAAAYCRSRDLQQASSSGRVEPGDVTGVVRAGGPASRGNGGSEFIAIECAR
jgi:hypothetical protein